jgi:hypothetical protein
MSHSKKTVINVRDGEYLTDNEIEKIVKKAKVSVRNEHCDSKITINKLKRKGVGGYILWLNSSTKKKFPTFVFSAENDILTQGLGSLVSIDKDEIVISEFNPEEWSLGNKGHEEYVKACKLFENRINKELKREDLRCIWFTSNNNGNLKYRDIYSNNEAEEIEEQEINDFLNNGGILWNYNLRSW